MTPEIISRARVVFLARCPPAVRADLSLCPSGKSGFPHPKISFSAPLVYQRSPPSYVNSSHAHGKPEEENEEGGRRRRKREEGRDTSVSGKKGTTSWWRERRQRRHTHTQRDPARDKRAHGTRGTRCVLAEFPSRARCLPGCAGKRRKYQRAREILVNCESRKDARRAVR